jgi:hypothetical protein
MAHAVDATAAAADEKPTDMHATLNREGFSARSVAVYFRQIPGGLMIRDGGKRERLPE